MEAEHKELHEKIWNCKCMPLKPGSEYCLDCEQAVVGFMNKYGAGELTRDLLVDELKKKINKLEKENVSLSKSLEERRARVVELKEKYAVDEVNEHG